MKLSDKILNIAGWGILALYIIHILWQISPWIIILPFSIISLLAVGLAGFAGIKSLWEE